MWNKIKNAANKTAEAITPSVVTGLEIAGVIVTTMVAVAAVRTIATGIAYKE